MPFTWEEIQKNWLYSLPVKYSSEKVIEAFNVVEEWFGTNFFTNYKGPRGQYITTLIIDLSKLLDGYILVFINF